METERMSQKAFDSLLEYSMSLPTGQFVGKVWKCKRGEDWFIGEYVNHPDPKLIRINWRKIMIQESI